MTDDEKVPVDPVEAEIAALVEAFMVQVTPNYHSSNASPSTTMDVSKADLRACATVMLDKSVRPLLRSLDTAQDALADAKSRAEKAEGKQKAAEARIAEMEKQRKAETAAKKPAETPPDTTQAP